MAGLELDQLLVDVSYFIGLQAIRVLQTLADKNFIQSEIDLIENTKRSYYLVLIAVKRNQLVAQNQARLQQLLSETEISYQNGFVEKLDVDRVQVNLSILDTEKQQVDAQVALSRRLLNIQMGLPMTHPTALSDTLDVDAFSDFLPQASEFDPAVRIEYERLNILERVSELNVRRAQGLRYPSLHFKATAGYIPATMILMNSSNADGILIAC